MIDSETSNAPERDPAERVHRVIVTIIVSIMAIDFVFVVIEAQWLNALSILTIAGLILAPTILGERHSVQIPYEFQLVALVFVFAALFLGEVRSYYDRFWWWDIVLHTTSGLLLGIFGFLLVYILNESRRVHLSMRPRFVDLPHRRFAVPASGRSLEPSLSLSLDLVQTQLTASTIDK